MATDPGTESASTLAMGAVGRNLQIVAFSLIGFFVLAELGLYLRPPPGFSELAGLVVTCLLGVTVIESILTGEPAPQPPRRGLLWGVGWRYGMLVLVAILPLWVGQALLAFVMPPAERVRLVVVTGPVALPVCAWAVFSLLGTWLPARVAGGGTGLGAALRRGITSFAYIAPRLAVGPGLMMLVANLAGLALVLNAPALTSQLPAWMVIAVTAAFGAVTAALNTAWVVFGAAVLTAAYVRARAPAPGVGPAASTP